jgi:urease accessory protein
MFRVINRSDHHHGEVLDAIVLPYGVRQKGRFLTASKTGLEVGVFLPRGEMLRSGDCLHTECGQTFMVQAQAEEVVTAVTTDWLRFSKACYHLGNRHVPMQIGELWLRFQPDHVLEEMITMMGLECRHHLAEFNPENGAYHGSGQHHHHDDTLHDHDHVGSHHHSHEGHAH